MRIIICGAGQVGWQIARQMASENHDVTIVDSNDALVEMASDNLDVRGITGFASYPDVLAAAGAENADMIIAATHADEVNMVTCQIAHSMFQVPRKIARLRAQAYLDATRTSLYRRDNLPIDVVISPEREVAEAALQRLFSPATFDNESFLNGGAELLGIRLAEDCAVLDTPLRQLSELFSSLRALVIGVRREARIFVPEAEDQLYAGDEIYLMAHIEDSKRALDIFGKAAGRHERVVIIGGGNVGLAVAERLEARTERIRAKLIERDRRRAEVVADRLERFIVLHGDGLDMDMLNEAGITKADAVLAVTDDDRTNLLACARAKSLGCPTVVALVNDPSMASLMPQLGIDSYVNPRATTVSSILRHVRHGRIKAVYSIGDSEAELIEAEILSTSPLCGRLVRESGLPEGSIIAAIAKGDAIIMPDGDTRLDEHDVLVVFTMKSEVPEVERLFQVTVDYF